MACSPSTATDRAERGCLRIETADAEQYRRRDALRCRAGPPPSGRSHWPAVRRGEIRRGVRRAETGCRRSPRRTRDTTVHWPRRRGWRGPDSPPRTHPAAGDEVSAGALPASVNPSPDGACRRPSARPAPPLPAFLRDGVRGEVGSVTTVRRPTVRRRRKGPAGHARRDSPRASTSRATWRTRRHQCPRPRRRR